MELARPFAMSQPAISKHLRVLERAGLISRGHDAQRRPRRLEAKPLAEATAWLEAYRQFWEGRFQRLDTLLDGLKALQRKSGRSERDVDLIARRSTNRKTEKSLSTTDRIAPATKRRGRHQ